MAVIITRLQLTKKGYGLGGFFNKFIKWATPYISKVLPVLKQGLKTVGKEVIESASNIAKDLFSHLTVQTSVEK